MRRVPSGIIREPSASNIRNARPGSQSAGPLPEIPGRGMSPNASGDNEAIYTIPFFMISQSQSKQMEAESLWMWTGGRVGFGYFVFAEQSERKAFPMPLDQLLTIIEEISHGNYSGDIMPLTAPDQPEPIRSIAEAMGMLMVKVEGREYQLEMLVDELRQLNEQIRQNTIGVMAAMARALEARDEYTRGHADRVADWAEQLALKLGLDPDEVRYVKLGGLLHDIGKIGFPDDLFQDHGKKNPSHIVREIVKHPSVGYEILSSLDFLGPAVEFVRCHHERPDGKGYPRQLKDSEIPLGAKILAVSDAFDAMTTDRPYQKGRSFEVALEILQKGAGKQWDARCVGAFAEILGSSQGRSLIAVAGVRGDGPL